MRPSLELSEPEKSHIPTMEVKAFYHVSMYRVFLRGEEIDLNLFVADRGSGGARLEEHRHRDGE